MSPSAAIKCRSTRRHPASTNSAPTLSHHVSLFRSLPPSLHQRAFDRGHFQASQTRRPHDEEQERYGIPHQEPLFAHHGTE